MIAGMVRDGIRFHHRESGQGLPVVFQHGLGGDVGQPFGLLDPLPGYRLLAMDFRGHGRTSPLGDPESLAILPFADDLAAWLDGLGVERAVVGGISLGAAVALAFALRYPERTLGLILSRPAWLDEAFPVNVRIYPRIATLIRDQGAQAGLWRFRESRDYQEIAEESPDAARSLVGQFEESHAEANVERLETLPRSEPPGDRVAWGRIAVPTLVLANRQDPIHPFAYGEALAGAIPGSTFHELTPKSVSVERHADDVRRFLGVFLHDHFPAGPSSPC